MNRHPLLCYARNAHGAMYAESQGGFRLEWKGIYYSLRFCEYISLYRRLQQRDWAAWANDLRDDCDHWVCPLNVRGEVLLVNMYEASLLCDLVNETHWLLALRDQLAQLKIAYRGVSLRTVPPPITA